MHFEPSPQLGVKSTSPVSHISRSSEQRANSSGASIRKRGAMVLQLRIPTLAGRTPQSLASSTSSSVQN
ncbi:unnamed protein product [Lampetra planeri]